MTTSGNTHLCGIKLLGPQFKNKSALVCVGKLAHCAPPHPPSPTNTTSYGMGGPSVQHLWCDVVCGLVRSGPVWLGLVWFGPVMGRPQDFLCMGSLPIYVYTYLGVVTMFGKTSHMGRLPIQKGKSSHVWPDFPNMGGRPICGKSPYIWGEGFPFIGRLAICQKPSPDQTNTAQPRQTRPDHIRPDQTRSH